VKRAWLAAAAAAGAAAAGAGCELREITIAEPQDVIIAEVLLWADQLTQSAYLHRTSSAFGSARVFDASITVADAATGAVLYYEAAADSLCLRPAPDVPDASIGTCYIAQGNPGESSIRPGHTYTLRIEMRDGRVMTGTTMVPDRFEVHAPAVSECHLPPGTRMTFAWSPSTGAAVYLLQTRMHGLREALREDGVPVTGSGPVTLTGLSITAADTTLSFPDEIGLFDRFDETLHPILVAISDGLPANVRTEVAIVAVDPNYVNWIRGGTFNPSGTVRLSSVAGDGTGVFGAAVVRTREIHTAAGGVLPRCD
jgi:hypothetical protein